MERLGFALRSRSSRLGTAILCFSTVSMLASGHWTFEDLKTRQVASDELLVWKQTAPGMAGSNRRLHADSVDAQKLWATPDMGNDYLTLDGGKRWESVVPHDGPWSGRQELSDVCVVSDPKNPSVVLSLTDKGWWSKPQHRIELSTDGGRHFYPIEAYAEGSQPDSAWYTAVAHPVEDGTWYVANGLNNNEYRTGANPNPLNEIDTAQPKVWKITDITESSRSIAAIPNDGMDSDTAVFDLFCHPDSARYPDMLFAATSTGVYRRSGESSPWVRILEGSCKMDDSWDGTTYRLYVLQQATYSISGNTIESNGGVFEIVTPEAATLNSGWVNKTEGLMVDLTQLNVPVNRFRSFVKLWFGYSRGEEGNFQKPRSYFPNFDDILCDPTNPDRLYLANGSRLNFVSIVTGAVWATLDGGDTWYAAARAGSGFQKDSFWEERQPSRTNQNMEYQVHENKYPDYWAYDIRGCRTMAISADGTLYAGVHKAYYTIKYDADADWWTSVDNTQVGHEYFGHGNGDLGAYAVIPDIHRPGEMFLLQQEASLWKTTDSTHPDFPGVVAAYEVPGLVDHGPTWTPGVPYIVPTALAQHPSDPDVFYFLSPRRGNFSKSSDNGLSFNVVGEPIYVPDETALRDTIYWRNLRIGEAAAAIYAVAEVVDSDNFPMGQTRIFNHRAKKGVYKSVDEGKTWEAVNSGLPVTAAGRDGGEVVGQASSCVKGLVMDPQDSDVLYAAAKRYFALGGGFADGGLYRTGNGASAWEAEGIPSGIKSLWDVWLHVENGFTKSIYIAGGGDGSVSDWGEGGVWVSEYKPKGGYEPSDWRKVFDHPFCAQVVTSPFDENRILVATRETSSIGDLNQGTYLTLTGGAAGDGSDWAKVNKGRGPMPLSDIAFDNGNPDRIWCSAAASGSYSLDIGGLLYSNWVSGFGLDEAEAAFDLDPDGDEMSNLAEYAMGGDPTRRADRGVLPMIVPDSGTLKLVHVERKNARGVLDFVWEASHDLKPGSWQVLSVDSSSGRELDGGFVEVTQSLAGKSDRLFLRLTVESRLP